MVPATVRTMEGGIAKKSRMAPLREEGPSLSHGAGGNLADSIFEVDREGNFIIVPPNLERITGFSKEELGLLTLQNLIFSEDQPKAMNAIESVFSGSSLTIQEVCLFSEGSGSHPVELILLPRKVSDRTETVWGAIIDIGDRVVLKERIAALTEGQERLKVTMKDFVNLMTREIRQPLTSMLLTLELLETGQYGDIPQRPKEKIANLIDMIERTKDILNEALEMSRSIGGDFKFERKAVSLKEIVKDVLKARSSVIAGRHISLRTVFRDDDILVNADRKAINQVVETLIDNAIKASPEKGEVIVELDWIQSEVQFAVSDSGEGIPDSELEGIFDRLNLDPSKERESLSVGLGLFIAKRIVAKHGGRIWCESFVGLGSTFFFALPGLEVE
jgi:PAS domain S-box-containing protein